MFYSLINKIDVLLLYFSLWVQWKFLNTITDNDRIFYYKIVNVSKFKLYIYLYIYMDV